MSEQNPKPLEYVLKHKHEIGHLMWATLVLGLIGIMWITTQFVPDRVSHHDILRLSVEIGLDRRIVADEKGRILVCSRSAASICGYSVAELVGSNTSILVPPEMRERHRKSYDKSMETGVKEEVNIARCELLKRDGSRVKIELSIWVVEDEEMGRVAVVTITPVEIIKFVPPPEESGPVKGSPERTSPTHWTRGTG